MISRQRVRPVVADVATQAAKREQAELDRSIFWHNLSLLCADRAQACRERAARHAAIYASVMGLATQSQGVCDGELPD